LSRILRSVLFTAALLASAAFAQKAAPATGGVLFVGSSIFHRWTNLTAQMAPLPIVNRAFDGAQTFALLSAFGSMVIPYGPKVVVYYCGSNDVDAGEPAAAIFERIRQFVDRVGTVFPASRVVFVSINRAPEKQDRWDIVDAVNRRVEALAAGSPRLRYVDMNQILFGRDGQARLELYMSDQLHLRPAAYEEFARILKPVLTDAFSSGPPQAVGRPPAR
jgi:hypothetical protein